MLAVAVRRVALRTEQGQIVPQRELKQDLNGIIINILRGDPLLPEDVIYGPLLPPKLMSEISIADVEGFEHFGKARFIAPGCVSAVRDAADVDDVGDIVRLDELKELEKAVVAMPNREDCLRHTSLYNFLMLNYNYFYLKNKYLSSLDEMICLNRPHFPNYPLD